jgi:oxaloacetate decarboxylase alpha subunit
MAGIMGPKEAYDLVLAVKASVKLPVVVHTHMTTGLGAMTLLKAVEAGADVIDTAVSSFSGGTSQPATETMAYTLRQMGYGVDLADEVVNEVNDYFKPLAAKFIADGTLNPAVLGTSPEALNYQIPGGMLSNLVAQLTAQQKLDLLDEVLRETPKVREDLGYPPLVTPMSQMVGAQAASNVLAGERYKNISKEVRSYVKGEYGKAPGLVSEALQKNILGSDTLVTCRFADLLEPGLEAARTELGSRAQSEEDVLSYIAFPQQAEAYFEAREAKKRRTLAYSVRKAE